MRFDRLNPSPQPRFLVVNPGLNTLRKLVVRIPLPVSVTSNLHLLYAFLITTWRSPFSSMASRAFFNRFSITQSKRGGIFARLLLGYCTPKCTFSVARFRMYSTSARSGPQCWNFPGPACCRSCQTGRLPASAGPRPFPFHPTMGSFA